MYTLQNPNRRNSAEAKVVSPALDGLSLWHWYVVALLYSESFLVTEGSKPATTEAKSDHMPKNWPAIWFCNLKTKKLDLVQILLDCFRFLGFFFFSLPLHDEHFGLRKKSQPSWCCLKQWARFLNCFECCAHSPLVSSPAEHTTWGQNVSSLQTVFVRNAAT